MSISLYLYSHTLQEDKEKVQMFMGNLLLSESSKLEQKGLRTTLALDNHKCDGPLNVGLGGWLHEEDPCLTACFGHKTFLFCNNCPLYVGAFPAKELSSSPPLSQGLHVPCCSPFCHRHSSPASDLWTCGLSLEPWPYSAFIDYQNQRASFRTHESVDHLIRLCCLIFLMCRSYYYSFPVVFWFSVAHATPRPWNNVFHFCHSPAGVASLPWQRQRLPSSQEPK